MNGETTKAEGGEAYAQTGRSDLREAVRQAVGDHVFDSIQRLADLAVVSDARMLDFLSRKDARVYRHQADCVKDLLRLLRSDAFPLATAPDNEVSSRHWDMEPKIVSVRGDQR